MTGVVSALAAAMGAYYYLAPGLPSAGTIRDVRLQIPLRIYTRDGRLIEQIGKRRRKPVAFESIPPRVSNAFLAAEDDRFYEHPGYDYQGIARAAFNLLLTGSRSQGGSTITQQLAREYFLTRDRTFVRKAKELILALQIEKECSKEEILELYLNKIFLGQRAYGVAAAAQVYFGKTLDELTVAEAATLAGLPKAPSSLNPITNPTRAIERRTYVLRRMNELNFIDQETFETSLNYPMVSKRHGRKVDFDAPYVASMADKNMLKRFGQTEAYTGGYKVVTTIDSRLQRAAQRSLRKTLLEYDQRHGYRGVVETVDLNNVAPSLQLETVQLIEDTATKKLANQELQQLLENYPAYCCLKLAVVLKLHEDNSADVFIGGIGRTRIAWENLKRSPYLDESTVGSAPKSVAQILSPGDIIRLINDKIVQAAKGEDLPTQKWRLAQIPEAEGAIVSMDPFDGAITALSGGFDFARSKYNRAKQANRQPGSAIKPFIYSAALENGYTAATIVKDAPIVVNDKNLEALWRPENYSGKFYGDTRLREGLVRSMNLVSLQTLRSIGISDTIKHLKPFGFPPSGLPQNLTLALGSGEVTPLDLVGAYAGLASGGHYVSPYIIERIEDVNGNIIYQAEPATTCEDCADHWFDGREKNLPATEFQIEPVLSDITVDTTNNMDAAAIMDVDGFISSEPLPPPVDAEVPHYNDVEDMILSATTWRPTADETPEFFAGRVTQPRIVAADNAYIVYDMMRDVVKRGTGRSIRDLGRDDLAGKTGTTNEGRDTWFAGFNKDIAAAVWVGFDAQARSLGRSETGGKTALPMWKNFIGEVLKIQPESPLQQPETIVTVRISSITGKATSFNDPNSRFEIFSSGTEPRTTSSGDGSLPIDSDDSDIFEDGDIF
ncbi:MAG: penicillin-binding protein 1A [Gammaproteobacteria bacterium]|nr:penicillin-binding protein 1A [Gammaproteobacteria bacterium]